MPPPAGSGGFARGALSFSGIVAIGAFVGLVVTPFTTRLFDPAALGRINMFGTYLALLQVVSLAGFDQGYMRFYSERTTGASRRLLLRQCIVVSVTSCLLIGVVSGVLWEPISNGIVGAPSGEVVVVLVLAVVGSVLFRYAQVWSRVAGNALDFLRLTLTFAVLTKVSIVVAGMVDPTYMTGILFLGAGYIVTGGYALALLWKRQPHQSTGGGREAEKKRPLAMYSLPFLVTGLLGLASTSLVSIPVERILGFEAVGVFSAGLSLASFVVVVQMGIQSYWAPYAYATHRIGPDYLRNAQQVVLLVICGVGLLAMAASPVLFLLLGPSFRDASGYFGLLVAPPVITLLGEVGGVGLLLAKRSWVYSLSQAVGAAVTVSGCVVLVPQRGLLGAGLAMTLGALATAVLRIALARAEFRPFTRPGRASATSCVFLGVVFLQAIPSALETIPMAAWAALGLVAVVLINLADVGKVLVVAHHEVGAMLQRLGRADSTHL